MRCCVIISSHILIIAEARGLRGTGIGCFFDDPSMNIFFNKPTTTSSTSGSGTGATAVANDRTYQDLYHFTIGGPLEDTRLRTLTAYSTATS
jgi:hypothetical protein